MIAFTGICTVAPAQPIHIEVCLPVAGTVWAGPINDGAANTTSFVNLRKIG